MKKKFFLTEEELVNLKNLIPDEMMDLKGGDCGCDDDTHICRIDIYKKNTSYCKEIAKLVTHIQNKIIDKLPQEIILKLGLSKLDVNEII
jgi:hypothetical protein